MLHAHGIAGISGIDTRRLTRVIRTTGAVPGAFGPADDLDALRAAASQNREPTRSISSPPSRPPSRTRFRPPTARNAASSPTTTASSGRSCVTSAGSEPLRSSRRRRQRPTCWPATPMASSCPMGLAIRRTWPGRRASSANCSDHPCRCSASASATNCWRQRSAAPPSSCRSDTTAPTTRSRICRPGGSRSPARTTTSPCPPMGWPGSPPPPTSTSTTGSVKGSK